jgi:hypothetical protein
LCRIMKHIYIYIYMVFWKTNISNFKLFYAKKLLC